MICRPKDYSPGRARHPCLTDERVRQTAPLMEPDEPLTVFVLRFPMARVSMFPKIAGGRNPAVNGMIGLIASSRGLLIAVIHCSASSTAAMRGLPKAMTALMTVHSDRDRESCCGWWMIRARPGPVFPMCPGLFRQSASRELTIRVTSCPYQLRDLLPSEVFRRFQVNTQQGFHPSGFLSSTRMYVRLCVRIRCRRNSSRTDNCDYNIRIHIRMRGNIRSMDNHTENNSMVNIPSRCHRTRDRCMQT